MPEVADDPAGRGAARAEGRGEWGEAAALYAAAFRAALAACDIPAAVTALRGQARVRGHERRYDEAEELATLSLEIAERAGLAQAAARALNLVGMVLYLRGDWEAARRIYPQALERALDLGDDDLAGLACLNAGVIANSTGEVREARMLYLEGVGSFVRSGNSVNAMLAYNNLGLASADLREWMEAELYFARGIEIGERLSRAPLLAKLYCNRAEPLIQVGDHARAQASLGRAERIAREVGDTGVLVEVHRFRGMSARVRGLPDEADTHLRRGLAEAVGGEHALVRAETLRELALVRIDAGRHAQARALLQEAHALFAGLGAVTEARRVSERIDALSGG